MLLIQDRGRTERVPLAEVLYFKAELKYITVRTAARSYILDASLSELEERHAAQFLRVHRNALVARRAMRALEKHDDPEEGEGWAVRLQRHRRSAGGVAPAAQCGARGAGSLRQFRQRPGSTAKSPHGRTHPITASRPSPPLPADPEDPSHVLLRVPVNVRSMTLVVLTVLAVLATLRWASPFFIPLMLGFMFSYALSPVIDALERWRIPRSISAAVLILGILFGTGYSVYSFSDDANQLVESLPAAAKKLRDSMRARSGQPDGTLGTVQKAAAQLEQAAKEASPAAPATRGVQRVVIEKPSFDIRDHLWTGTIGLASLIGQVTVVTFLTYFLLLSGDTFRRKLVKITGPSLSNKKITVQALDEITGQIQRYLLVQLLASVVVGITTGLAFWALGLEARGGLGHRRRHPEPGALHRVHRRHRCRRRWWLSCSSARSTWRSPWPGPRCSSIPSWAI